MSYHILHQFDEQWLTDLTGSEDGPKMKGLLSTDHGAGRKARHGAGAARRWVVIAASTLLAAFALLIAVDANRRADALQQRLDSIEAAKAK